MEIKEIKERKEIKEIRNKGSGRIPGIGAGRPRKCGKENSRNHCVPLPSGSFRSLRGAPPALDPKVCGSIRRSQRSKGVQSRIEEIRKQKKNEETPIPDNLNFENVVGLSNEVRQKLTESKPNNMARAARLPGITPAAISLLLVHLNRG